MASVALTAPQSWGWAAGSTLYAGVVNGFDSATPPPAGVPNPNGAKNQTSWYAGATLATPVTGLKCGVAYDYMDAHSDSGPGVGNDGYAVGLYTSYQATEKLSFHARGELVTFQNNSPRDNYQVWAGTATAQYDLWQNVISRLEFRWDHGDEGLYFGGTGAANRRNAYMVAANIIYKF